MEMYKENSFFQAATNVKKLGAYYTDVDHCKRIGMLFDFDLAEEICVLEPSVGDGSALMAVTGSRPNIKRFAVEINPETYREYLKENENFISVLNEDFLRGVKISHGVFSFCFANPPYGEQRGENGSKRLEVLFLERLSSYLKSEAYLVYVIPYHVFTDEKFFRMVMTRYRICSYYRFDDKEYEKYHQVAVILQKKKSGSSGYLRTDFEEAYQKALKFKEIAYLPEKESDVETRYEILPSKEADIEYFTTMKFKPEEACDGLKVSALYDHVGTSLFQKVYSGCDLNRPIVPVSKDIAYLLAVSGGGQGLAGDEEEGTLHLQRGVARMVEEDTVNTDEKGVAQSITTRSYTKIKLNIIQNNGKITQI